MQDWCSFPMYFDVATWKSIEESPSATASLEIMLSKLVMLGLRAPSEPTQAMLAGTCILCDGQQGVKPGSSSSLEPHKLRSLFLNVKSEVRVRMAKAKAGQVPLPGGEYVVKLPPNPEDAPKALQEVAFQGSKPEQPPFSLFDISNIAREIKLRSPKGQSSTSSMACPDGQAFWHSFQSLLAMAQHLTQPQRECNLSFVQNKPARALENLLHRAEPQAQLALPAPAQAMTVNPGNVEKQQIFEACALSNTAESERSPLLALPPAPLLDVQPKPAVEEDSQEVKLAAATVPEKVNDLPQGGPNTVSLSDSMAKLQQARAKAKGSSAADMDLPVMKRPAAKVPDGPQVPVDQKPPSRDPKSHRLQNTKAKMGSKVGSASLKNQKKTVSKAVAKKKVKTISPQDKCRLRDQILSKLDLKTKKRFANGCSKCRQRPLCTLSCWKARGF